MDYEKYSLEELKTQFKKNYRGLSDVNYQWERVEKPRILNAIKSRREAAARMREVAFFNSQMKRRDLKKPQYKAYGEDSINS